MTGTEPGPQPGVAAAPSPVPVPADGSDQPGVAARPLPAADVLPPRSARRRWVRVLRVVVLVITLPLAAFVAGLFIAWIVHLIRGSDTGSRAASPAAGQPPSLAPSRGAPASASAPAAPRGVGAPAGWVTEVTPPAGLTYRHPPGWVRRTSLPVVLRFAPAAPGSTAPGVEGVGAGFGASTDPARAVSDFVTRAYGGQPRFAATPASAVATAGRHPGEQQAIVTYSRSGVDVRVVVHGFRSGTRTVLVLGRAGSVSPGRAAQLEAFVEASLQISG